jgi:hypothetical protein
MTFLHIVERELRVAARQRRTYRMRAGSAFEVTEEEKNLKVHAFQSQPKHPVLNRHDLAACH